MSLWRSRKPGFALCLTYYLPNISGLTLSAHEVARHLAGKGHPVRVVTGRVPPETPPREMVEGMEIVRSNALFSLGKALVMPGYGVDLWRSLDGVDVVNVHLPCLDAAVVALVAKLRGRKLIVSYISSMSRATVKDRLMRAAAAVPHLLAGWLADSIQVVSPDYAEASTFCRLFRHKLDPAPLPIALGLLPGENRQSRVGRVKPAGEPYRVGYVGRIARQKSLGVLLDAIPAMTNALDRPVVVELAGPASDVIGETHWQEILAAVAVSGGKIVYRGVLTGQSLADFYADLDVMVLPSVDRLESFGLVQVEAMLRRVPVVASDLPGMRVPVERTGMGRLFSPGDPAALAAAVIDVLENGPPSELDPAGLEALFGNEVACAPYVRMLEACSAGPQ